MLHGGQDLTGKKCNKDQSHERRCMKNVSVYKDEMWKKKSKSVWEKCKKGSRSIRGEDCSD